MPITQDQMLEQVAESRANNLAFKNLYSLVHNYIQSAKGRYPGNNELQETLNALDYTIRLLPLPDDRATYMNEQYYRRFGAKNAKSKLRQRGYRDGSVRRRREWQEAPTPTIPPDSVVPPDIAIDDFAESRAFRDKPAQPNVRAKIIFPRDDPDDKELEFETLEDLPAPRDQNNLLGGLDLGVASSDSDPANNERDD